MANLTIDPKSVTLPPRGSQAFQVRVDDHPAEHVDWILAPANCGTLDQHGIYTAPGPKFSRRLVTVTARVQTGDAMWQSISAAVDLPALPYWTRFLGLYWIVTLSSLLLLLFVFWKHLCPNCVPPEVVVNPPIVTLTGAETQQFTANVPVVWSNPLTQNGMYIDASESNSDRTITVTATSSDKKVGSATIIRSKDWGLIAFPNQPNTLEPGAAIEIAAQITGPASAPGAAGAGGTLAGAAAAARPLTRPGIHWLSPPIGRLSSTADFKTTYTAPKTVKIRQVVTIVAQLTGVESPKVAGVSLIILPSSGDTCPEEDVNGVFWKAVVLILVAGAIGGLVHGASSFATYVGNDKLLVTWVWWYILRPFIAGFVALLVYLVFRGGFSGGDLALTGADCLKTAAFAGLIGLFSEPALLKLRDIFDTIFTIKHDPRAGKIEDQNRRGKPLIETISPASAERNTAFTLTINGSNFAPHCIVKVSGQNKKPASVTPSKITVDIGTSDLTASGAAQIVVANSPPDGDLSEPIQLTVT